MEEGVRNVVKTFSLSGIGEENAVVEANINKGSGNGENSCKERKRLLDKRKEHIQPDLGKGGTLMSSGNGKGLWKAECIMKLRDNTGVISSLRCEMASGGILKTGI